MKHRRDARPRRPSGLPASRATSENLAIAGPMTNIAGKRWRGAGQTWHGTARPFQCAEEGDLACFRIDGLLVEAST